jgi:hypothetical protein
MTWSSDLADRMEHGHAQDIFQIICRVNRRPRYPFFGFGWRYMHGTRQ